MRHVFGVPKNKMMWNVIKVRVSEVQAKCITQEKMEASHFTEEDKIL